MAERREKNESCHAKERMRIFFSFFHHVDFFFLFFWDALDRFLWSAMLLLPDEAHARRDAGYGFHLPFLTEGGLGFRDRTRRCKWKFMIQNMLQYVRLCLPVCLSLAFAFNGRRERSGKMLTAGCISSKCVHMRECGGNKWLHFEVNCVFVEFVFFVILCCAIFEFKGSLKTNKHAKQYFLWSNQVLSFTELKSWSVLWLSWLVDNTRHLRYLLQSEFLVGRSTLKNVDYCEYSKVVHGT